MTDYRSILRRVGWVLVVFGMADIGLMVYSIAHHQSYSSSFNIFAVIAGMFLIRGSLKAVRATSFFAAFFVVGFSGSALLVPFSQPLDLWRTEFRLHPASLAASLLLAVVVIGLSFWVYRELRTPPVMEALAAAGQSSRPPWRGFGAGAVLVIGLAVAWPLVMNGAAAHKAELLAMQRYGSAYKYRVRALEQYGDHYQATLTAYNKTELRTIHVQWRNRPAP